MNKIRSYIKDESGSAIIWVLIVFVVIVILTSSAIILARQDVIEAMIYEKRLQTYYIAKSGVEIGYAAVLTDNGGDDYIEEFIDDPDKTVTDTFDIKDGIETVGEAEVDIKSIMLDGKRWIQITSVGKLEGESILMTSVMRIDVDNTDFIVMDTESLN